VRFVVLKAAIVDICIMPPYCYEVTPWGTASAASFFRLAVK